jgi:hypothetical protein
MGKTDEERKQKREDKDKAHEEKKRLKEEEKRKRKDDKEERKSKKDKEKSNKPDSKPNVVVRDPIIFPVDRIVSVNMNMEDLKKLEVGNNSWNVIKLGHGYKVSGLYDLIDFDNIGKNNVLKVNYPRGSFKPSSEPEGGIGFYASPSTITPSDINLKLKYKLYFDSSFDPQLGGKLPGLFMGPPGASGGRHSNDNASCRIMWRTFVNEYIKADMEKLNNKKPKVVLPSKAELQKIKDKEMIDGEIECEAYVYNSDDQDIEYSKIPGFVSNNVYGDSLWRGFLKMKKNKWNDVEIYIKMNSFTGSKSNKDGILSVTINGNNYKYDKMKWVENKCNIEGITFDTFFGGGSEKYATPVDTSIYFKDFELIHEP